MPSHAPIPPAETTGSLSPNALSPGALAAIRAELDRVDDALHDLLIERSEIVARLAASGRKSGAPIRPGREAAILRRLLGRHTGPLDRQAIVRIWRELLAGTTAMQGQHTISVSDADPNGGLTDLAREHFGALTPIHVHRNPAQALAEISAGTAAAAVLPLPTEGENTRDSWWTNLLESRGDETRLHVVARLPFWSSRPDGASRAQALVVSLVAPDPSGLDRSLLGTEIAPDSSRARLTEALVKAGLQPESIILRRDAA